MCLTSGAVLGICVVTLELVRPIRGLSVEALDAMANNGSSLFYCLGVVREKDSEAVDGTGATRWGIGEHAIKAKKM